MRRPMKKKTIDFFRASHPVTEGSKIEQGQPIQFAPPKKFWRVRALLQGVVRIKEEPVRKKSQGQVHLNKPSEKNREAKFN